MRGTREVAVVGHGIMGICMIKKRRDKKVQLTSTSPCTYRVPMQTQLFGVVCAVHYCSAI